MLDYFYNTGEKMNGIKITMKDGTINHYDPARYIDIDNGHHVYRVDASKIKSIDTYKIKQ